MQGIAWGARGNVVSRVGLAGIGQSLGGRRGRVWSGAMAMYYMQGAPEPGFEQGLGESPSLTVS